MENLANRTFDIPMSPETEELFLKIRDSFKEYKHPEIEFDFLMRRAAGVIQNSCQISGEDVEISMSAFIQLKNQMEKAGMGSLTPKVDDLRTELIRFLNGCVVKQ